jgi:hypothetical protein
MTASSTMVLRDDMDGCGVLSAVNGSQDRCPGAGCMRA